MIHASPYCTVLGPSGAGLFKRVALTPPGSNAVPTSKATFILTSNFGAELILQEQVHTHRPTNKPSHRSCSSCLSCSHHHHHHHHHHH